MNAGDHPPITPCASASEAEIGGGDAWRLYDYVVRHFLGCVSKNEVLPALLVACAAQSAMLITHALCQSQGNCTAPEHLLKLAML